LTTRATTTSATRKTATAYELYLFGGATAEFAPVLLNDMWRLTIPFAGGG